MSSGQNLPPPPWSTPRFDKGQSCGGCDCRGRLTVSRVGSGAGSGAETVGQKEKQKTPEKAMAHTYDAGVLRFEGYENV